jgi:hypothetical protein
VLKHLQRFCRVDTTTHDCCCCHEVWPMHTIVWWLPFPHRNMTIDAYWCCGNKSTFSVLDVGCGFGTTVLANWQYLVQWWLANYKLFLVKWRWFRTKFVVHLLNLAIIVIIGWTFIKNRLIVVVIVIPITVIIIFVFNMLCKWVCIDVLVILVGLCTDSFIWYDGLGTTCNLWIGLMTSGSLWRFQVSLRFLADHFGSCGWWWRNWIIISCTWSSRWGWFSW